MIEMLEIADQEMYKVMQNTRQRSNLIFIYGVNSLLNIFLVCAHYWKKANKEVVFMDKKQSFQQPPDTGKLTNFHYGNEKDDRTPEINQKAGQQKSK